MAEYIERDKFVKAFCGHCVDEGTDECDGCYDMRLITHAPSIEIVRCRECVHRVKYHCDEIEFFECDHIGTGKTRIGVTDNWFCADGKRREDGAT